MKKLLRHFRPELTRIGGILISALFFFGGLIALCNFISLGIEMHQAKGWSTTNAVITDSYITVINLGRSGQSFLAEVKYQFQIDGKSYTGDRLSFFNTRETREENAKNKLVPYPIGVKVNVFYDASNPGHSTLVLPTFEWTYFFLFAPLTVILILVGIFLFKVSWYIR